MSASTPLVPRRAADTQPVDRLLLGLPTHQHALSLESPETTRGVT